MSNEELKIILINLRNKIEKMDRIVKQVVEPVIDNEHYRKMYSNRNKGENENDENKIL